MPTLATIRNAVKRFYQAAGNDIVSDIDANFTALNNALTGVQTKLFYDVIDYGAKGDTKFFNDGNITAGTNVLNSASANFQASDVGKLINIAGAATGIGQPRGFYITGVNSTTQITLSNTSANTVTGGYFCFGTNDTTAITNAVIAGAANKRPVYLSGLHTVTSSIILNSNNAIVGAGIGLAGLVGTIFDNPVLKTTQAGTGKTVYTNISLKDFSIFSHLGHCMQLENIAGLFIDSVEVTHKTKPTIRQSMYIEHCQDVFINKPWVHDTAGNGLQINSSEYVAIALPNVARTADDGIDIDKDFSDTSSIPSKWVSIAGGTVRTVFGGNGIRIGSSHHINVAGTVIDDIKFGGAAAGIFINSYENEVIGTDPELVDVNITGTTITNCEYAGIAVAGANVEQVNLGNNNIRACGKNPNVGALGAGIILDAANVLVNDNWLDDCGISGGDGGAIIIFKKNGQQIANNRITNSQTGINAWNGDTLQSYTGIVITDNYFDSNVVNASLSAIADGIIKNNVGLNPEKQHVQGSITGATTFNRVNGNVITATLTGSITATITNGQVKGDELTLILTQDGTGNRVVTWPSNFKKVGGTLTLSTAAGAVDIITMRWDGTNWREVSRSLNLS